MSKQVISSTKKTNSFPLSNTVLKYKENQRNLKKDRKETIPQSKMTKEIQNKFTGQTNNNFVPSIGTLQQINTINQNICTCSKFKKGINTNLNEIEYCSCNDDIDCCECDDHKGYCECNDDKDYCECEEHKDHSLCCNVNNGNINKTFNKVLNLNVQNIFIQEGSNIDYCQCDKKEDKTNFTPSTHKENLPNVLKGQKINIDYCTCSDDES